MKIPRQISPPGNVTIPNHGVPNRTTPLRAPPRHALLYHTAPDRKKLKVGDFSPTILARSYPAQAHNAIACTTKSDLSLADLAIPKINCPKF